MALFNQAIIGGSVSGKQRQGGCLCGAIRYQLDGDPFAADYCHCGQCRRVSGAPVTAWMDFNAEQVHWLSGTVTEYASSEKIRRGFCSRCGSCLTYRHLDYPQYTTLAITSLDDADDIAPNYHIYMDDALPWFEVKDDHLRHPTGGKAPKWAASSHSVDE